MGMSKRDLTVFGTSSQQPTRFRNHGGYLLFLNGEGFLFDPGEGCQRQYIHANIAPPMTTRIFISHFHGDHCLGVGSMLMRLNLDGVTHPIHCYYPKSGKKYFDRLRFGTMYHDKLTVIEHPIEEEGIIEDDGEFIISAFNLEHGVDNLAYRIEEKSERKYDKEKLQSLGIRGELMRTLRETGSVLVDGKEIHEEDVSYVRKGDSFIYISDTKMNESLPKMAINATMLLCESTYLHEQKDLAKKHKHMTAKQAGMVAEEANVGTLVLTHYSARYPDIKEFEKEAKSVFSGKVHAAKDLKSYPFEKTFEKKTD